MSAKEGKIYTSHTEKMLSILPEIILNNEHFIVFCSDDDEKILLWNRAAEIVMGYAYDDVPDIEALILQIYPDASYRSIITQIRDSFRKKENKTVHYESKIKTKSGSFRYISWTTERVHDFNSASQLYLTTGTDVTHARQSENDVLLLSEIVNSSHDAIVGISLDGSILSWNRTAEEIFEYGETESIGESFYRHISDENKNSFASILRDVAEGKSFRGNVECLTKTGSKITASTTISPISGEDGLIEGISAIIRDITREMSLQVTMRGYISEATMRLNHPVELVEGNIRSLIERIGEGDLEDDEILIELQVQEKALSQIIHNLRELSQAVIGHFKNNEEEAAPDNIQ